MGENHDVVVECCWIHDICSWYFIGYMKVMEWSCWLWLKLCLVELSCCCWNFDELSENYVNW